MMSQGQIKEFPLGSWTEVYRSAFVIHLSGNWFSYCFCGCPYHSHVSARTLLFWHRSKFFGSFMLAVLPATVCCHTTGSWLILLFSRFSLWPNINHICNPISKRL